MSTTDYQPPIRPVCLPPDERAQQRLAQKSWIKHLLSSLRQRNDPQVEEPTTAAFEEQAVDIQPIELVVPTEDKEKGSQDKFAWAILYENQRGMTIFSIPYYSRRSLLPRDPAPFTPPSSLARAEQSFTSLDDYQLPDGTWCWVSKVWMIDMRSDTGEVQYDGFEYNWMFRKHHWRAEIGPCSAGGWVRRRRWIRLMMRPGKLGLDGDKHGRTTPGLPDLHADNVWLGQNPEDDWSRCHILMKRLDTDGHKLEVWYAWLEPSLDKGKGKEIATDNEKIVCPTEVMIQVISPPRREHIIPVLRRHLYDILHLFVFPDTRAKWLALVAGTGVLSTINNEELRNEVDFWSYSEDILKLIQ